MEINFNVNDICHTGSSSCFKTDDSEGFIRKLQKVGEEAVETVISPIKA